MLVERLFENLALSVEPFATCRVAPGWRLQLPRRDWVILHFVLQGKGSLRVGKKDVHPLTLNCLALMPPRLNHAVECGVDVRHETGVRGDETGLPLCELGAGPADEPGLVLACGRLQVTYGGGTGLFDPLREAIVLDFSDSPSMRATFESLVTEYRAGEMGSAAMMAALMNQCLIYVFRRLGNRSDGRMPWLAALEDPGLARALDEILSRPEHPHSLHSLADAAHMSRSVFARRFHECFDRTPMEYLRDVRLRRAAKLLERGELSVSEVAARVGFRSRSYFSRAFHERFGRSPAEFRVSTEAVVR
jgi:AraC-like DNA-binding protein